MHYSIKGDDFLDFIDTRENNLQMGKSKREKNTKNMTEWLKENWLSVYSSIIITIVIPALFTMSTQMGNVQARLDAVEKTMATKEDIAGINGRLDNLEGRMTSLENRVDSLENRMTLLEGRVSNLEGKTSLLTVTGQNNIQTSLDYNTAKDTIVSTGLSADTEAFKNKDGVSYTANELINKRLLVTWEENGQTVYFLGQYNEDYNWDGNCILNVYKDDELIVITDAIYDGGKLLQYCQILNDDDRWVTSKRFKEEDANLGKTWVYKKNENVLKTFDNNTITESNIFNYKSLLETINSSIESYYNGSTSDGKYNDTTGNAYLIKYAEDGTVKTLYYGQFKDGLFEDATGNAWYVTKEKNTDYMYYKGNFSKGNPANNNGSVFENPISKEKIQDILTSVNIDCDLKWYND